MELSAFRGASHFTKILEGPRTLATTLIGVRSTKTDHKTTMLNVNSHNSLKQFSTVKGDEVSIYLRCKKRSFFIVSYRFFFLGSILLTSLLSFFYVTRESYRFLHRGQAIFPGCKHNCQLKILRDNSGASARRA